jgi:hypothetical protein
MATPPSSHAPLSWSTAEFEEKNRHPDWIWYVGLIFGIGAVFAFFYHDIFFGIFLVVAGTVTIIYALQKPKLLTVSLDAGGITINGSLIPYNTITAFSLDETGKPDKLLLQVKGSFVPVISIPLVGVTAKAVEAFLDGKAPAGELRESTSVKIFDRFGF